MGSWDGVLPAALPSGFVPTGAEWEAIRDAVASLTDPWNTYTPSWTASVTNPTIGNGAIAGTYLRNGKYGRGNFSIDIGSTTNVGSGTYSVTLPPTWTAAASGTAHAVGVCGMRDNSVPTHNTGFLWVASSGTAISIRLNAGNAATNALPWVWATSDFIYGTFALELV